MRGFLILILISLFLFPFALMSQEKGKEEKAIEIQRERYDYNPQGRRDPFLDLLSVMRQRHRRGSRVQGIRGVYSDEIVLVSIAKRKDGKYFALILDSRNFPYTITVGTKLADGEVIKITENEVVIRQITRSPVFLKPYKDIVLKLNMEE
ncbi:MAG: hypothetical protein J7L62_02385 [Candidatus Aminicenantes bacterium]|nr:hypothetical protein [Candidatus Aminicenantes bacterium]